LTDVNARPSVVSYPKQISMPAPAERQFTVAGMNLENFFDDQDDPEIKEDIVTTDSFNKRMRKISVAVRGIMQTPDVIGIVEAENLAALKRLAEKINADAEAAGKPNPKYEAYLIDGNDGRGIDVGYLVKSARVKVLEIKQLGKEIEFTNANTKEDNFLNDRPSLMLRASVTDAKTNQPFELSIVVNHLKSMRGYDDPKQMDNVRLKKQLQAAFLASWVNERQKANPQEKLILIGDFNAFQFNDGVMDVVGTIKGAPPGKEQVLMASDDLVETDLVNLVDLIKPEEQYSYRFDGNGQVLDHVIISSNLMKYAQGFGYARINADFPESYRGDDRPERFSDHDVAVAYFSLEPKPEPKPSPTP
jgi:predicted extracellular nuclease